MYAADTAQQSTTLMPKLHMTILRARQHEPERTVAAQLDLRRQETIAKNRELLKSISKTVYLCGRQGVALRSHRDDSTADPDANHGNFLELLRFRSDGGDQILSSHFESHCRNASYSSKTIQNQLITIIGDQIRNSIIDEVKLARFYSILADEVSDAAGLEQVTLVLRFIDHKQQIREEFVDFLEVERITGTVLADAILKAIQSYGLNICDCRGQGYDGASNMSSAARGVQGIIFQSSPNATYVHCNCHILNLAVVKACSLAPIRNMAGSVSETAKFFNYSPKRQRLLEKVIEVTQPDAKKEILHDLCRTRWIERHHAYEVFTELFPSVISTLDVMLHEAAHQEEYGDWNWDRESLTTANGLYLALTSFDFLMALTVTSNALASIRPLSVKLQRKSLDIIKAYSLVQVTVEDLENVRKDDNAMDKWFDKASAVAQTVDVEPRVRRTAGHQQNRDNVEHTTPEYFRRAVTIPMLDHLINGLKERFSNTAQQAAGLSPIHNMEKSLR